MNSRANSRLHFNKKCLRPRCSMFFMLLGLRVSDFTNQSVAEDAMSAQSEVNGFCVAERVRGNSSYNYLSLGRSVARDGNIVVSGVPTGNCAGSVAESLNPPCGTVRVYRLEGTALVEEDRIQTPRESNYFGFSVAVSGDLLLVGAPFEECTEDSWCGAAYLYRRTEDGWALEQRLAPSIQAEYQEFGQAVALESDFAIVSAPQERNEPGSAGAVYIFSLKDGSWLEQQRLVNPLLGHGSYDSYSEWGFGFALAIDGEQLVVGDPGIGAFVFRRAGRGWALEAELEVPKTSPAGFGASVAIDNDQIAVGASRDNSAYVYRHDGQTWTFEARVEPPEDLTVYEFGASVAIHDHGLIVGSGLAECANRYQCSRAFLFQNTLNEWQLQKTLDLPGRYSSYNEYSSLSFSLASDMAIIGDTKGLCVDGYYTCGAIYVVPLQGEDCNENGAIDGCDVFDNPVLDCNDNQLIDSCETTEGHAVDCNRNLVPDECDRDCQRNYVPDDCDIASGRSADCDANSIPDECDEDCNRNGLPDVCDLANNLSADCNNDARPDECGVGKVCPTQELLPFDPSPSGNPTFGGFAIDGHTAIVADVDVDDDILAHVYELDGATWSLQGSLRMADNSLNWQPHWSVAVSGDRAAMVLWRYEEASSRHLFATALFRRQKDQWGLEEFFGGDEQSPGIALDGDTLVIDQGWCSNTPSCITIYRARDGSWEQEDLILPPASVGGYALGDLAGETLVVVGSATSAAAAQVAKPQYISVFVFEREKNVWTLAKEFRNPSLESYSYYGRDVAVDGDTVVVLADNNYSSEGDSYSLLVYRRNGVYWNFDRELDTYCGFEGYNSAQIAFRDDVLVVSDYYADCERGRACGSACAYRKKGQDWQPAEIFMPVDRAPDQQFGFPLVTDSGTILVGSRDQIYSFQVSGPDVDCDGVPELCEEAYSFPDCDDNGYPDDRDVARRLVPDCNLNGSPDSCDIAGAFSNDCDLDAYPDECGKNKMALAPSVPEAQANFGRATDLDGDQLVVGEPNRHWPRPDGTGYNTGAAYIYRRHGMEWTSEGLLTPSDTAVFSEFGTCVTIEEGVAAVGSDDYGYPIRIFEKNDGEWTQTATINAPPFVWGWCELELDGNVLAVPGRENNLGVIHRYEKSETGWLLIGRAAPSIPVAYTSFGSSLAVYADAIIAGDSGDHESGFYSGAAYVFRCIDSSCVQEARLVAPQPQAWAYFGTSVAIEGDWAAVGAPGLSRENVSAGAVFVYHRRNGRWELDDILPHEPADEYAGYGSDVAIDGARLAIKGSWDRVLIYERAGDGWVLQRMLPTLSYPDSGYGGYSSVAMSRGTVAISAPDAAIESISGRIDLFDLNPAECACPSGVTRFLVPPNGVIDSRQPTPVDDSAPMGIDTFHLASPAAASQICWRVCGTSTESLGSATIADYSANVDGTALLTLSRPITPGAATSLIYTDYLGNTTSGTFTSHPGNVNADSATSAGDLLALIDIINGVRTPPFGLYSADIDHSGSIGLSDLLRLVDLLNGSGVFDPWLGTSLPRNDRCP